MDIDEYVTMATLTNRYTKIYLFSEKLVRFKNDHFYFSGGGHHSGIIKFHISEYPFLKIAATEHSGNEHIFVYNENENWLFHFIRLEKSLRKNNTATNLQNKYNAFAMINKALMNHEYKRMIEEIDDTPR